MPRTRLRHFFIHSILFHVLLGVLITVAAVYFFDKEEGGGSGGRLEPIIVGVISDQSGEGDQASKPESATEPVMKKSTDVKTAKKKEPLPLRQEKEASKEKREVKIVSVQKKVSKPRNEEPEEQVLNRADTTSDSHAPSESDAATAADEETDFKPGESSIQNNTGALAYNTNESAKPNYKLNPKPVYPQMARRRGYEGMVLLRVLVLEDGKVGKIELAGPSGYSVLDESALDAVKDWVFIPGRRGGKDISSWVEVPIQYRLDSG